MLHRLRSLTPLLLALLAAGCGDAGPERRAIEGTVLLDGEPLESGIVHFEPADGGAINASATVTNGTFTLELHGGLPDGQYKVAVSSKVRADGKPEPKTAEEAMAAGMVEYVERIAPEYNTNTTLTAKINRADARNMLFEVEGPAPEEAGVAEGS